MSLMGKWTVGVWLAVVLWMSAVVESRAGDAPAPVANPASWGLYAEVAGKTWTGEHGSVSWAWAADGTLVQSDAGSTSVIRLGERPGRLIQESGRLYTYDGHIAADGSVLWLRRGPIKSPMRISLKEGRVVAESVKVDDDLRVVDIGRARSYGPLLPATTAPAPAAPAATAAASASAGPVAPSHPRTSVDTHVAPAAAPKSGPRTLSEADLATLRQRIQGDKARRAQALTQERAAAEQLRQQLEQAQQMTAVEEDVWEEEPPAPAPNLAEVFLTTLGNEMAKNQAEREAQDAFIRDIERQQAAARERRQREEQRQRAAADSARQAQYAAAVPAQQPASPVVSDAAAQARQAQIAARDRELATQAAAERLRRLQLTQPPVAASATKPAADAAAKPLRFVLSIGLLNKPGDTVNPMCYSNVITRPGPPGWGGPGFLPPGSGEQAHATVHSLKDAFIARCRASGREITSEGNFSYAWNRSQGEEAGMQDVRPRHREDVLVSL